MQEKEKITLRVRKKTPSLNTLLGMNRWARSAEKREMQKEVALAIEFALSANESDSATPITWLGASSIASIRSGLRELFQKIIRKPLRSKLAKKKSSTTRRRKHGSK